MFVLNKTERTSGMVRQLQDFMVERGIRINMENYDDSSPYFILMSGTGVGYRIRSKWGEKGIVLFCAADGIDMALLSDGLGLKVYDNLDEARPYAIFIPVEKFEKAVGLLKRNGANV